MVVKYEYDAWGNHVVTDKDGNPVTSGIGVLNPFRYRSYYYDTETELYYLQTRYYDPELGRFISQDSIEYAAPETINGLNLYAYCGNNPVMNIDPTGTEWWNWLIIGIQAVAGVVACLVPGGQGLGISLLAGATLGAIAQLASPAIGQAIGGATSIANGWGAFSTGTSLIGVTPIGTVLGIALMAIGTATIVFGANEIAAAVTGENAIQNLTGLSDSAYGWTYAGLNIVSSLGQVAGNVYRLHQTRFTRIGRGGELHGYRYYDTAGRPWFDFDYPHYGKINYNHFHGWAGPGLTGRTNKHLKYFGFILWLIGGLFK